MTVRSYNLCCHPFFCNPCIFIPAFSNPYVFIRAESNPFKLNSLHFLIPAFLALQIVISAKQQSLHFLSLRF